MAIPRKRSATLRRGNKCSYKVCMILGAIILIYIYAAPGSGNNQHKPAFRGDSRGSVTGSIDIVSEVMKEKSYVRTDTIQSSNRSGNESNLEDEGKELRMDNIRGKVDDRESEEDIDVSNKKIDIGESESAENVDGDIDGTDERKGKNSEANNSVAIPVSDTSFSNEMGKNTEQPEYSSEDIEESQDDEETKIDKEAKDEELEKTVSEAMIDVDAAEWDEMMGKESMIMDSIRKAEDIVKFGLGRLFGKSGNEEEMEEIAEEVSKQLDDDVHKELLSKADRLASVEADKIENIVEEDIDIGMDSSNIEEDVKNLEIASIKELKNEIDKVANDVKGHVKEKALQIEKKVLEKHHYKVLLEEGQLAFLSELGNKSTSDAGYSKEGKARPSVKKGKEMEKGVSNEENEDGDDKTSTDEENSKNTDSNDVDELSEKSRKK